MTFHLAYASEHALLTSAVPVIKRRDRVAFVDALALLEEATTLRDRAQGEASLARDTARREALAEAHAATDAVLANGLADMARAIDAHAETRRADIAETAFAAARAIIGELDDGDVMQRIIDRTMARIDGDAPVTIEVSPALVESLKRRLSDHKHVRIVANADFAPTDCRILASSGQIVASLSVQFDALAARWGL